MPLPLLSENSYEARVKYQEYARAEKEIAGYYKQKKPWYTDLKKLYYHMKMGKKVVDIPKVMQAAGLHENGSPKMAIAEIDAPVIYCRRYTDGRLLFHHDNDSWNFKARKRDFDLKNCLPRFEYKLHNSNDIRFKAPVPMVPPQFLPKQKMNNLYILWEVDKWEMVAPIDPWLLCRITNTHCVLLQGWNLTELERSVMNAHI